MVHPQVPLGMPCYDLALVTELTVVRQKRISGLPGSPDLTGGEYRTRERIHRGMADPRLLAILAS